MNIPTRGELLAKISENLKEIQADTARLAHVVRDDDRLQAQGWLGVSELFKKLQHKITEFATRGFH